VAETSRVFLVTVTLVRRKFYEGKRRAQRTENDLLSVGRIRTLRVVPWRMGQVNEIAAVLLRRKDVEGRVVIPGVAPLFSARAKFQLRPLFRHRLWINVSRSEEDAISSRLEET